MSRTIMNRHIILNAVGDWYIAKIRYSVMVEIIDEVLESYDTSEVET